MTEQDENIENDQKDSRSITLKVPNDVYKRLLIKIRHENLGWKKFFNMMVNGFLDDDPGIMDYIDTEMANIRAKKRTTILKKERKLVQDTIDVFGLDKDDINDIYDILEEEFDP